MSSDITACARFQRNITGYLVAITASATVTVESTSTSASSTTTESASATEPTSSWSTIFSRASFVDGQLTSVNFAAIEFSNGRVSGFARVHLDKSESA